ncbi:MAG: hypothetical protein M0R77_18945 [Gammaproteobacteria bacterium]|nr:hypothetical protein [Gammaproteobacteria bacterium]
MRLDEFVNNKILNELDMPRTRGLAGNILKSNGYEKIGRGAYASVWAKPGENTIVKIFDNDDSSYKKFINLTLSNPNDHFPKIKGKMFQINDRYTAIRIERLEPVDKAKYIQLGLAPVYNYLNYVKNSRSHMSPEGTETMLAKIDELDKNQPGIKKALDLIAKNFEYFDFNPDNVMLRGNTIVITDPVN